MPKQMRTMDHMVGAFEVKSTNDADRTFEGTLSTSHLDEGDGIKRDIVHPGAFKRTLHFLRESAKKYVPLLDSHNPSSIMNVYGHMLDGEEVLTGKTLRYEKEDGGTLEVPEMLLNTKWQVIDGPDGDRVRDRMRPGSVRKMSMGYMPFQKDYVNLKGYGKARNLREVSLEEGSLVVFAMQNNAEVDRTTVKSLTRWTELDDEERREILDGLTAAQRAELRALLEPVGPALAPEELKTEIRRKLRRLTLQQLATRFPGPAPVEQTIAHMKDRTHGIDPGEARVA